MQAQARRSTVAAAVALTLALASGPVFAVELPVPCAVGVCGAPGVNSWVSAGAATLATSGNNLTVTQTTSNATYNWQSFNIGAGGVVRFDQPDETSVALNRIFQADPARILGQLSSNGRVYLLNRNGILFGQGAQVNVRGLVASSLDLSPEALQLGLARAASVGAAAFQPYSEGGVALASGAVTVEQGASLRADGGQVLIFAPQVTNRGDISTPDGQTILAAGQRIFLVASTSSDLRGLLVEVGEGGTVTNGPADPNAGGAAALAGRISADRGNVTLAGLAVNQNGRVSASTSIRANGSVRLLARDITGKRLVAPNDLTTNRTGELVLGRASTTEVLLDADTATTVDVNTQPKSSVEIRGGNVSLLEQARITATAGTVSVVAGSSPATEDNVGATPDQSRIYVAAGATIDVSGAVANLAMERNSLRVELRGAQLADSPVQRDGALRSEAIYVDLRRSGTRADGSFWRGTPLADLTGDFATIARDVRERNLNAGSVSMVSQGAVLIDQGVTINLSGGRINWQSGYVRTSQVLGADGRIYDIANADRDREYVRLLDGVSATDPRWGTTSTFNTQANNPLGNYEVGYVEGKDAGSLTVVAPRVFAGGSVLGNVATGPYQRLLNPLGPKYQAYSDFNVLPKGPTLSFGTPGVLVSGFLDLVLGDVLFGESGNLSTLRNADGTPFNPRTSALPASLAVARIAPSLINAARPSSLLVYSNGSVTLPAGATLNLADGASFVLRGGQVALSGSVTAHSGTASVRAIPTVSYRGLSAAELPSLVVGAGARFNFQGLWVNDRLAIDTGAGALAPLALDGGSVELLAEQGDALFAAGSVIDVSGGAQRRADGVTVARRGGSIRVGATGPGLNFGFPNVNFGSTFLGWGLERGGSLSLAAPAACIGSAGCAGAEGIHLASSLFSNGGFANYSVATSLGDLRVASDVNLNLGAKNWLLGSSAALAPTGVALSSLVTEGTLSADRRSPVSLSLTANHTLSPATRLAQLVVEAGARIALEPRGSAAFSSNGRVIFDGSVETLGGSVSVSLNPNLSLLGPQDGLGIWFGAGAAVNVSGTTVYTPRDDGRLVGSVLGGGSITVNAARGYVFAAAGSRFTADGVLALLDVRRDDGLFDRLQVASAGGAIRLYTTEGMQFAGQLSARSLRSDAAGGRLEVLIDTRRSNDPNGYFSTAPRNLVVGTARPTPVAAGAAIPAALGGVAYLDAATINGGGFDFISLTTRDVLRPANLDGPQVFNLGTIILQGGVALAPRARLTLDSTVIQGNGGDVSLSAAYVALGNTDDVVQSVVSPVAGTGTLSVNAGAVDLIGQWTLSGFSHAALTGTDGLRFRGVFAAGGRDYVAAVRTAGDVTISAPQVYASTLSVASLAAPGHALRFLPVGTQSPVLSVGSSLSLSAAVIDVATRVAAPGGTLSLAADQVTVRPSGSLSVALDETTLFGRLQGGFAWVYELPGAQTRVYDGNFFSLPAKQINVNAADFRVEAGGIVDLSGGHDLVSFEFVPGPGGTTDALSGETYANRYAVIPGWSLPLAPVDPRESRGTNLSPGDQVWLDASPGLAAGYYTLLPARYALLPGAVLVEPVAGFGGLRVGTPGSLLDGTTVVAGYRAVAGTPIRDALTSGFAVRSLAQVLRLSSYDVATANAFFNSTPGLEALRTPADAGALSIGVTNSLNLAGSIRTNGAVGGSGASIGVAASRLRIASQPGDVLAGWVTLLDSQLSALRPETLVVGGAVTNGGTLITAASTDLEVLSGTALTAPRLVLVAGRNLTIRSGATVEARGGNQSAPAVTLRGDTATVILDSVAGARVGFTGRDNGRAVLTMESGSTLAAQTGGAITVAGAGTPLLAGNLSVRGSLLRVLGTNLTLAGGTSAVPVGSLDVAALSALGATGLVLEASRTLSFQGQVAGQFGLLELSSPVMRALTGDTAVSLRANQMRVTGGASAPAAVAGLAQLSLAANRLVFGDGNITTNGFGSVSLAGAEYVGIGGTGSLSTVGNLALSGAVLATASGADYQLNSSNSLTLTSTATAAGLASSYGTSLGLRGRTVSIGSPVLLPSGGLRVNATADIDVGSAATIDVAAPTVAIDNVAIALGGGNISLVSTAGNVSVASGAALRLDGAAGGDGGKLVVSAAAGTATLHGAASASGGVGGALEINAAHLDFSRVLGWAGAGFQREVVVTAASGDLTLAADQQLRARRVVLDAEAGIVDIGGRIEAPSSDGRIELYGRNGVTVSGTLRAGTQGAIADSGLSRATVVVGSESAVRFTAGSVVDLVGGSNANGSTLRVRLPEEQVLAAIGGAQALRFDGQLSGVRRVLVEGYRQYNVDGVIADAEVAAGPGNPWYSAATSFVDSTIGRGTAVGLAPTQQVSFTPGIDVAADGDLLLLSDWNLAAWQYRGVAPTLTVRASGDFMLAASISDGFTSVAEDASGFTLPGVARDSATIRLVAGSALNALNPLQTAPSSSGSLIFTPGLPFDGFSQPVRRMVRTGTGDIEIATAGDLVFSDQSAVIYTAGRASTSGIRLDGSQEAGGLDGLAYPEAGGDVRIRVGRDFIGTRSLQLYTDWLLRTGSRQSQDSLLPRPTAWTVAFANFEQGIGALAGGSVNIDVGGDATDLNVMLPTVGKQVGGNTVAQNRVEVIGGGNLRVAVGGDVGGGTFLVGAGIGEINSAGEVGAGNSAFAPILAVGDGTWKVTSRQSLGIEAIVNPTLVSQAIYFRQALPSTFSTYSDRAAASMSSVGGSVRLSDNTTFSSPLAQYYPGQIYIDGDLSMQVMPPTVAVAAPSGDIRVLGSMALWPAPRGNLSLLAGQNVIFGVAGGSPIDVVLSDARPGDVLPTVDQPSDYFFAGSELLSSGYVGNSAFYAPTPVHGANGGLAADPEPARVVAVAGDIRYIAEAPGTVSTIFLAKRARFVAGRDIVALGLRVQHASAGDVTVLSAGRDITYPIVRGRDGRVSSNTREIVVDGPGELLLRAGRDIDLGTSKGVVSDGNLRNPRLPANGASISMTAGLGGTAPNLEAFIADYLASSGAYDSLLFDYLKRFDSTVSADKAAALARFRALSPDEQRPLLETVLLRAVRVAGRAAAVSPTSDFTEAYRALTSYFPGSNPDVDASQVNAYRGDVKLYFSRVYTLAGGDVRLLSPGGGINAGLATPPTAYGIRKAASELGVVVQGTGSVLALGYGDFQVNESRVIAGNGGDILVWSTRGDIDAGRGAKTAISAPPPIITIDETGQPKVVYPAAFNGSGIQTLATTPGVKPGNVDLFAPRGVVNAGDAGIVAGNLTIAATAVLGASNISVSGTAVGVPVDTGGLGASLAGASNSAAGASKSGGDLAGQESNSNRQSASNQAEAALNFLDVAVVGLGEDVCRPDDLVCLKNQKRN